METTNPTNNNGVSHLIAKVVEAFKTRDSKDRGAAIPKQTYFFDRKSSALRLVRGAKSFSNVRVRGTVGDEIFGIENLKFISVSLTGKVFTEAEVLSLIPGLKIWETNSKGKRVMGRRAKRYITFFKTEQVSGYRLKVSRYLPPVTFSRLWSHLVNVESLARLDRLVPISDNWLVDTKEGSINFLVTTNQNRTFAREIGTDRKIFYRARKELWNKVLSSVAGKLLVVNCPEGSYDGDLYWRNSWFNQDSLVRATFRSTQGKRLVLKGRGHWEQNPLLPDGSELPLEYAGWTSQHNVKWLTSGDAIPSTIDATINMVKDESEDSVEEGVEKRRFSITALLMCNFSNEAKQKGAFHAFGKRAEQVARMIRNLAKREWKDVVSEVATDEKSGIFSSMTFKHVLGLTSENERKAMTKRFHRMTRSIKVSGTWAKAVARASTPRGSVCTSVATAAKLIDLYGEEQTYLRYPAVSHQSYFTAKVVGVEGLRDGVLVFNDQDAKYLQLDGDDHVLVMKPYSAFKGGEDVICSRELAVVPLDKMDFIEMYVSGACTQAMLGMVCNSMLTALDTHQVELASKLGQALDAVAQSIKKPYDIAFVWDLIDEAQELIPLLSGVGKMATACNISEGVKGAFGVELGEVTAISRPEVSFGKADAGVVKFFVDSIATSKNGTEIRNVHSRFRKWVLEQPTAERFQTYAAAACATRNSDAVELMEGVFILIGVCDAKGMDIPEEALAIELA